uniref:NADH dehydrogenase subunit 4L n=1 Tax=Pealius mori TaxID=1453199 RepID=A0A7G2CVG4_9HEMI|nr:NADH dehydrogenase subunit 4L [Pealius mori]WPM91808.1 NADH dehydrogenase subunit 4L [Pealius mori]CAD5105725.1 NADH dehydrogenase subunit 4L [Pealius mori]
MMNFKETMMPLFMVLMLTFLYVFNKYHVFNNLIIAEFIVISILFYIFKMIFLMKMENYTVMFILIIMITESVLGLSLMVNLIRTHSNDFMKSMTIIKF